MSLCRMNVVLHGCGVYVVEAVHIRVDVVHSVAE